MASLKCRRGAWELRYREPSGKQRTERFLGGTVKTAPEEALDRTAEVERDLRQRTHVPREAREARFGEYFDKWWAARRNLPHPRIHRPGRADLHVLPHWAGWRICDIRPSDVDDWIAELARKMGPTSVRHCYTLLRGPTRRAVKDRVIADALIDIVLPAKPEIIDLVRPPRVPSGSLAVPGPNRTFQEPSPNGGSSLRRHQSRRCVRVTAFGLAARSAVNPKSSPMTAPRRREWALRAARPHGTTRRVCGIWSRVRPLLPPGRPG